MRLPFKRSEPGMWISGGVHGAVLLAALVSFGVDRLPENQEGIAVEVVTEAQVSEMTKGERTAAKVLPDAKPRADRIADTREERDPGEARRDAPAPPRRPADAKLAEEDVPPPPPQRLAEAKPETIAVPPPPRPVPPQPDPKVEAAKAAEAKAAAESRAAAAAKTVADARAAAAAKAEAEKQAEQKDAEALEKARVEAAKARAVADAKAKADADAKAKALATAARAKAEAEAKAELDAKMQAVAAADARAKAEADRKAALAAAAEAKAKADGRTKAVADAKAAAEAKARKQAEAAEKFSPGDISKLLASKESSQSSGATGRDIQKTASLGTATGSSQRLNPSQRDQLVGLLSEQLHRCWQVPIAAQGADKPPVPVLRVKLNPDGSLAGEPTVMNSGNDLFRTVADSATRATRRCAPLKIPSQFQPYYQDWRDLVVNFDPRDVG